MRNLFLLFLLSSGLYATTILNYNFFEREERLDLMLSFDSPFEHEITMQRGKNYISVMLKEMQFNDNVESTFTNGLVEGIKIYPSNGNTYIVAATSRELKVLASKAANGFGLRIRLTPDLPPLPKEVVENNTAPEDESIPGLFKSDIVDLNTYISVLVVLVVLLAILYYVKKKIVPGGGAKQTNTPGWLFNKIQTQEGIQVLAQKQLDVKNRAILFETHGMRYLVIIGSNNVVVLDKQPVKETQNKTKGSQFDAILNDNTQQLDRYLELDNKKLEEYKNKASGEHAFFSQA